MAVSRVLIQILGENSSAVNAMRQVNREMETSRRTFEKDFGEITRIAQRGAIVAAAALAGVALAVREANQEYDALIASNRKLSSAAKLTGADLAILQSSSAEVRDSFELSRTQANEYTVSLSKLAAKAGDVRKTSELISAFINTGAAQGLNLEQTLGAVQQAILGIDEGTDKLFQKNPSVIYDEFAQTIGTTAAKLTEQQKAQALVNEAMETSRRVGSAYVDWLKEAGGQQQVVNNRLAEAKIVFAEALQPARIQVLEGLADAAEDLGRILSENQEELEAFASGLIDIARAAADAARMLTNPAAFGASLVERLGNRDPILGDQLINPLGVVSSVPALLDPNDVRARQLQHSRLGAVPRPLAPLPEDALKAQIEGLLLGLRAGGPAEIEAALKGIRVSGPDLVGGVPNAAALLGTFGAGGAEGWARLMSGGVRADGALASAFALNPDIAEQILSRRATQQKTDPNLDADRWRALDDAAEDLAKKLELSGQDVVNALASFSQAVAGMINGRTSIAGGAAGIAGGLANLFTPGGTAALALGGASIALSFVDALTGGREREEEQYRAHLRALRDARREQMVNVTVVVPDFLDPTNPRVREAIAETVDMNAGDRLGRVTYTNARP